MPQLRPVAAALSTRKNATISSRNSNDLQIIAQNSELDYGKLLRICTRLFTYRKQQTWPPKLDLHEDWRDAYDEWTDLDGVKPTLEEAVSWANDFIRMIDKSTES